MNEEAEAQREKIDFITHINEKVTQIGNGRIRTRAGPIRPVQCFLNILHMSGTVISAGKTEVNTTVLMTMGENEKRQTDRNC